MALSSSILNPNQGSGFMPKVQARTGAVEALAGNLQLTPAFPQQQLHPMDGKAKEQVLGVY